MMPTENPKTIQARATAALLVALAVRSSAAFGLNVVGELLRVPADYPTISQAIEAASSGDEIRVAWKDGGYRERLVISSDHVRSLRIAGEGQGERPTIAWADSSYGVIELSNLDNLPFEVELEHLVIDGSDGARYGIKLRNALAPDPDQVYNKIEIKDCVVGHAGFGIELGTRCGANGCDGQWGAVDQRKLGYSRSEILISRSVIYENYRDGLNLYRVGGELVGNLVFNNGDEGCHTTDTRDFRVAHNIFDHNLSISLHLHLCQGGVVENNVITRSQRSHKDGGGLGIAVGGGLSEGVIFIDNNLVAYNAANGILVQPTEIRVDSLTCIPASTQAELRNNIVYGNGWAEPDSGGRQHQIRFERQDLPEMRMLCEYNLFRSYGHLIWGESIDDSNLRGTDPLFSVEPDPSAYGAVVTLEDAWGVIRGYELSTESPCVDGGDPLASYHDAPGGLTKGTSRNDIGIFGGPRAIWPFLEPRRHSIPGTGAITPLSGRGPGARIGSTKR
ncbi:MAG: hypothetical protein CME06_15010 [Gemmatimonadetes bacterium]|nr:hypothetical protein [Gemmatimonadota bacterium]